MESFLFFTQRLNQKIQMLGQSSIILFLKLTGSQPFTHSRRNILIRLLLHLDSFVGEKDYLLTLVLFSSQTGYNTHFLHPLQEGRHRIRLQLQPMGDDDVIICIPTKDIVLYTKANDKKLRKKILKMAEEMFEKNRRETPYLIFGKDVLIYTRADDTLKVTDKYSY